MFIFSQIRLSIRNRDELRRDIDALTKTLACTDSARHVQSLSLVGFLDHTKPRNEKGTFENTDYLDWWKVTQNCEPLIDHVIPIKEPIPRGTYVVYDECVIEENSDEDRAWVPVVTFIKALPSLVKLVYECPNQFPPSLLDSLHNVSASV
jgi:hypothetical protein